MFLFLDRISSRTWLVWLAAWVLLWADTWLAAPCWHDVAKDGEFNFLPRDVPSRRGERLLQRAFPGRRAESSVVIVVAREGDRQELTEEDRRFIADKLRPGLRADRRRGGRFGGRPIQPLPAARSDHRAHPHLPGEGGRPAPGQRGPPRLRGAHRADDRLLRPAQHRRGGQDRGVIGRLRLEGAVPAGLRIALTGSEVLGRDMMRRVRERRAIHSWTIWLVIILLLVFYLAPLIALIPLVTLYVAVQVALSLLALFAQAGYLDLFRGLEVYTTVVVYAAGVDYNLFLISRYQEEVEGESRIGQALTQALGKIGGALAATPPPSSAASAR